VGSRERSSVIRWGAGAPSDMLRRNPRCAACGHRGGTIRLPSFFSRVASVSVGGAHFQTRCLYRLLYRFPALQMEATSWKLKRWAPLNR
jgi:hypothetical protein